MSTPDPTSTPPPNGESPGVAQGAGHAEPPGGEAQSGRPGERTGGDGRSSRDRELGIRVLHMILFAVVFWILCWTLAVTAILQLVLRLVSGQPNADVARFGAGLGRYARQVIEFLTFSSDRLPFPFSEWPGAAAESPPASS